MQTMLLFGAKYRMIAAPADLREREAIKERTPYVSFDVTSEITLLVRDLGGSEKFCTRCRSARRT
eukprot:12911397-Prorocentrum_lima.AAC.1